MAKPKTAIGRIPPDTIYVVDLNGEMSAEPLWEILRRETHPAQYEDDDAPLNAFAYFREGGYTLRDYKWLVAVVILWSMLIFSVGF
jgi:hypothetical protein